MARYADFGVGGSDPGSGLAGMTESIPSEGSGHERPDAAIGSSPAPTPRPPRPIAGLVGISFATTRSLH